LSGLPARFRTTPRHVWLPEPGAHRPDIGRNSFTIKDRSCGDGFQIHVEWRGGYSGSRTHNADCGEESFSIEKRNVATKKIEWRTCRRDIFTAIAACSGRWESDSVT